MFWSGDCSRGSFGLRIRDAFALVGAFATLEDDVCVDWDLPAEFDRFAAEQLAWATPEDDFPPMAAARPVDAPYDAEGTHPHRAPRGRRGGREPGLLRPATRNRHGAPPPRAHVCLCPLPEPWEPCDGRAEPRRGRRDPSGGLCPLDRR